VQINLTSYKNRLTKKSSENFMREYDGIENDYLPKAFGYLAILELATTSFF
jgi:hypothetical protein